MNKKFLKITQVMKVAQTMTIVQAKNDDHYVWISKQSILFFEIYMSMKSDILFNVMDIVFQLKDKGIPITVPFCMKKIVLYIYMCVCVCVWLNLFYCVLHCRYEM